MKKTAKQKKTFLLLLVAKQILISFLLLLLLTQSQFQLIKAEPKNFHSTSSPTIMMAATAKLSLLPSYQLNYTSWLLARLVRSLNDY